MKVVRNPSMQMGKFDWPVHRVNCYDGDDTATFFLYLFSKGDFLFALLSKETLQQKGQLSKKKCPYCCKNNNDIRSTNRNSFNKYFLQQIIFLKSFNSVLYINAAHILLLFHGHNF